MSHLLSYYLLNWQKRFGSYIDKMAFMGFYFERLLIRFGCLHRYFFVVSYSDVHLTFLASLVHNGVYPEAGNNNDLRNIF